MSLPELPRVTLAALPTPVEFLPRMSKKLGCDIFLKRDDLTGLALGGNKVRKLEYLAADALAQNADTLVTAGAPQSNHCRQTAAAAAKLGLRAVLVLSGNPQPANTGNLLLDNLLGAEIRWSGNLPRESALSEAMREQESKGFRPYLIPYGGSNPLGVLGYIQAMREWADQRQPVEWIVFASSSAGTQTGLALGAKLFDVQSAVLGISVDLSAQALGEKIHHLAVETIHRFHLSVELARTEIRVDDGFLGGGYGVVGEAEKEAIGLFSTLEGVLLDPVYTGRAGAGLIGNIRRGGIPKGSRVLFWHTGGTPALWAYSQELLRK